MEAEEGEVDFHGMKRKQLQSLCKRHGIPANKSNVEMANFLAQTLRVNKNSIPQGHGALPKESDLKDAPKKFKKVRFSPEIETREYEPTACKQRGRRKTMVNLNSKKSIQGAESELSGKVNGTPPRTRRSRAQKVVENDVDEVVFPVIGKKRGRRGENKESFGKEKLEFSDKQIVTKEGGRDQAVNGGANRELVRRQLRSGKLIIVESGEGSGGDLVVRNATGKASRNRGNGRGSDGIPKVVLDEVSGRDNASDKEDAKAANDPLRLKRNARKEEGEALLAGELAKTEITGRNTRSRTKLGGNTSVIANKAETFEVQDAPGNVLQLEEPLKGLGRVGLRQKFTLPLKGVAGENLSDGVVEHEVGVRRSKRNVKCTDSGPMQGVISRRKTRSTDQVAENVSATESEAEVIDVKERHNMTVQLEEPLKAPSRNASSQKPVLVHKGEVGSERAELKKETRKRSRNSDTKVVIKVEASVGSRGEVEKAPIGHVRRSRRNAIMLNSTVATVQLEESLKAPVRNASSQKPVLVHKGEVASERAEVEKETRKRSRNSDTKVVTDVEASVESRGEVEKVSVPIGQLRRSMRNTIMLNSTVSTDEFEIVGDVGKVGLPKQKRIPVLEKATLAVVAKRLAGKPQRRYAQHVSESVLERGADFGNDESKDLGLGKIQTKACDMVSPVNGFLSENKSDFTGLETGIERRKLSMGEDMHYKSDVVNDHSIEVVRISALEVGACGLQKTELENTSVKNDLEQAPHDDTASPAVGEKMVNESIESTLLVDGDVIVAQIDSNKRNVVSERNSCNVSEASREMCVHELLDGVETCVNSEEVTDGGENCSAAIVPLQLSGIGNKSLPFSAGHSSVDWKTQQPPKHLEDQQLSLTKSNAIERGCALLSEPENFLSVTCGVADASDERITTKTDLSCKDEMDGPDETQADALPQSSSQEFQDTKEVDTAATKTAYNEVLFQSSDCIDEIDGETKVIFHVNILPVEAYPGQKTPEMLSEKLSGDADLNVPISKYHEIVTNVVDGNGIIGESDVEHCEALGKKSGCAVEAELGDPSGCQKLAVKVNANADSHFTKAICEESEKSVEMMSHHDDSHIAIRETASGKNMERELKDDERDQVVRDESGCAVEAEHGDHIGCQKVAVMVNANADSHFTKANCEESEKLVEMTMAHHGDSHIAIRETASGKYMERELNADERDQALREETVDGTFVFEVYNRSTIEEVVPNLNYSIVASLTPALSKEREFFEGKDVELSATMPERIERTDMLMEEEGKAEAADLKTDINDHIVEGKTAGVSYGDLRDDICRNGEAAEKESLLETTERLDLQDTENEGASQPNCPMGSGKVLSDYDGGLLKIIVADCSALPDVVSADCNIFDETSDGVIGSELELVVEVNGLELEKSDFIAAESCISTDIVAASINENVQKVEDDFKLKHTNIDDDRECNIATFLEGNPKGITEPTVEQKHQERNNNHNDVSNDANGNTEVGADEAGVAITGKICFESEDPNKWTERTLISSQMLDSSRKKTKQNSLEQILFLDRSTSFGKCGMGSSADITSDLNVFSSHGEKYEAHPRSWSISNQAEGKVMASSDRENSLFKRPIGSALFANWEVNVIQGNEERDQVVKSDEASEENLIKNDSELTLWVDKNVEEVDDQVGRNQLGEALLDARNEPISDGGEMSNGRNNVFAINLEHNIHSQMVGVSRFSMNEEKFMDPASVGGRANAALDKHTAELALLDLKIDNIPYPVIQDTCEQGLGTTNEVSTAANAEMGIQEDVGVGGTLQPVIPAEASHEMVENTQQETHLICSKLEENISTERIAFAYLPFGKREITSGSSVMQHHVPAVYGAFVTPSCYMSSDEGEETTCDYNGSNSTEHDEIHQQDCEPGKAGEATKDDATDGPSLGTNPCDHQDVTLEQAKNQDAANEVLIGGLDCQAQTQTSCENNAIETKEGHCLHELDDVVSFKVGVNFEDLSVTSPSKCQINSCVFSAIQERITEKDAWELNLFFGEDEQGENEKSNALILQTNLRNEDAGKLQENANSTEEANVQVEQHCSIGHGMDDQIEEAKHTFFSVSAEANFEDVKGSMNQDYAPLKADSLHERIDRENLGSVNVEHSHLSLQKEIVIEVSKVNAFRDAVSSERSTESDPRNLQEDSFASCCIDDVEGAMESSVAVRNLDVSIADQSPQFTNSAIDQDIAAGDDQMRQLKLPSPQKVMGSNAENEGNSVHAKQLNSSVNMKNYRTSSDQGTPLKLFNHNAMKENVDSVKREQTGGNMAAPRTLQKRRALEDLRNN